MATRCDVIQLLEPTTDTTLFTDANSHAPEIEEGGVVHLVLNVLTYNVSFLTAKLTNDYDFIESDITSVDANPLSIEPTMTLRTTTGFRLLLDSAPDTDNYIFNFRVRINSL